MARRLSNRKNKKGDVFIYIDIYKIELISFIERIDDETVAVQSWSQVMKPDLKRQTYGRTETTVNKYKSLNDITQEEMEYMIDHIFSYEAHNLTSKTLAGWIRILNGETGWSI